MAGRMPRVRRGGRITMRPYRFVDVVDMNGGIFGVAGFM